MNRLSLVVVAAATLLGAGGVSAQSVDFGIGGAGVRVDDGYHGYRGDRDWRRDRDFRRSRVRSSSFSQVRIVAAIGMDVVGTTKIAIE